MRLADCESLRWSAAREPSWPGDIARESEPAASADSALTRQYRPFSISGTRQKQPNMQKALDRYTLGRQIGSGGMATVHLGTLEGASGFRRPVAIKRVHGSLSGSSEARDRLRREGSIGASIRHPNVVAVLDLVTVEGEVWVVMEYVLGKSLAHLLKFDRRPPLAIVVAIMTGVLRGLHAAHVATGPTGKPLGIVHRDVSPQNIVVGADGFARILDFGVAKSTGSEATRVGHVKGKIGYFAPEQLFDEPVSSSTDIFAAGIVLWEAIVGHRMFGERDALKGMDEFMTLGAQAPSVFNCEIPSALDAVLACALDRRPSKRFRNAEDFAIALERVTRPASPSEVSRYLHDTFSSSLGSQRSILHSVEPATDVTRVDGAANAVAPVPEPAFGAVVDEPTDVAKPAFALLDALDPLDEPSAPRAKPKRASSGNVPLPSTAPVTGPPPAAPARTLTTEPAVAKSKGPKGVSWQALELIAIALLALSSAALGGLWIARDRGPVERVAPLTEVASPVRRALPPPPPRLIKQDVSEPAPPAIRVEDLPLLPPTEGATGARKLKKEHHGARPTRR